eukprot:6186406-Pleurochrysis_carterae.AAC.4
MCTGSACTSCSVRAESRFTLAQTIFVPCSAPNSVDVVYLWVNGSDPIRRRDYASATKQKKLEYNPSSARFRELQSFAFEQASWYAFALLDIAQP